MSEEKNYITPKGYEFLRHRLKNLLDVERPEVVKVVSWAAGNGDRSENGDYIYGKKKLRQIDGEIYRLRKSVETAVIVPPHLPETEIIFFGCTVTILYQETDEEKTIRIVGKDEINLAPNNISWHAPIARALLKHRVGDTVSVTTPQGTQLVDILFIEYEQTAL